MQQNRRRFDRVTLTSPLPALVGGEKGFILDLSLSGFRVTHRQPLKAGAPCVVEVQWEGTRARIDCRVVRSHPHRAFAASTPVHHSGLELVSAPPPLIREIIEWHVLRALDERKANARGIPPVAAQSFQTGGGRDFVRHELIGGQWRMLPTSDVRQPSHGFTVSSATKPDEVAMLRETFEKGDFNARRMLQRMAELSISSAEGIPTRKYEP